MKVVNTGSIFRIYTDDLLTYEQLPAQIYTISFSKMSGFYLEYFSDQIVPKEKIYGVHMEKVEKVMKSFDRTNRSLGVILSGDKGIGKSLFARILSQRAIEMGYPVIILSSFIPGVADFIDSIKQEAVILMDEYDKTFAKSDDESGHLDPQTEMLSLFDGVSQGKKLFVITCNELRNLNDYLVNRPGRFHYHFRFDYPQPNEIRAYLSDKNIGEDQIEDIIAFSRKVKLNYDCLRAIAFEVQDGSDFSGAIQDLNILNMNAESYNVILAFEDGYQLRSSGTIDMFSSTEEKMSIYEQDRYNTIGYFVFNPADAVYDSNRGGFVYSNETAKFELTSWMKTADEDDDEDEKRRKHEWQNREFKLAVITRKAGKNLHYSV